MDEQELRDKFEIQEFLTHYGHGVDRDDWDFVTTLFTPDAELDFADSVGVKGTPDVVIPALQSVMKTVPWKQGFITNPEIELDGDSAKVRALCFRAMQLPGVTGPSFAGSYYHHELVRTPEGWKSKRFSEEPIWLVNPPSESLT